MAITSADEDLLNHYARVRPTYVHFSHLLERYLRLKTDEFIPPSCFDHPIVFNIQSRAKSRESFRNNLLKNRYIPKPTCLDDVGDLAGARVIFFFEKDAQDFFSSLEGKNWFHIVKSQIVSGATPEFVKYEKFGYSSFHIDARIIVDCEFFRCLRIFDQAKVRNLIFELQIRTLFQHGWAEAEHELRYKKPYRQHQENREWGILAALVELSDRSLNLRRDAIDGVEAIDPAKEVRPVPLDYRRSYSTFRKYYKLLDHADTYPTIKVTRSNLFNIDGAMGNRGFKSRSLKGLPAGSLDCDSVIARADNWDQGNRKLSVGPARYSDQIISNSSQNSIVRRRAHSESDRNSLLPFRRSPLANGIGISTMIRTSANKWIIARRSKDRSYSPGAWGVSASSVLPWSEKVNPSSRIDQERLFQTWVIGEMHACIYRELGLTIRPENLHYIGFTRELIRLGKPQFFFMAEIDAEAQEFTPNRINISWRMYADPKQSVQLGFLSDEEAVCLAFPHPDIAKEKLLQIHLIKPEDSPDLVGWLIDIGKKLGEGLVGPDFPGGRSASSVQELRMNIALSLLSRARIKEGIDIEPSVWLNI